MGVHPFFQGILCHDYWKSYYNFGKDHALCNANHLRELERAQDKDNQKWAAKMMELLSKINKIVDGCGGCLDPPEADMFIQEYGLVLLCKLIGFRRVQATSGIVDDLVDFA